MKMRVVACAALLATAGAAFGAAYDAQGFEPPTFTTGPLNNQDGWVGYVSGGGIAPAIVTAPDPVFGMQAVRLEVPDVQGAGTTMEHAADLTAVIAAGGKVTISFDVYRQLNAMSTTQNLWWWLWDAGTPTYGLQWDTGNTLPYGWNPGAGSTPTIYGRYANVTMEYDFGTMTCSSWYDGVLLDNAIPINPNNDDPITTITGFSINLSHDAATGTGGDIVWIDNFVMVPEPAALLLLGLGALVLRRR